MPHSLPFRAALIASVLLGWTTSPCRAQDAAAQPPQGPDAGAPEAAAGASQDAAAAEPDPSSAEAAPGSQPPAPAPAEAAPSPATDETPAPHSASSTEEQTTPSPAADDSEREHERRRHELLGTEHAEGDEGAPLPGQAQRLTATARAPGQKLLWIPRLLMLYPRLALSLATLPLEGLARLEDNYDVREKVTDFFFNDERTFGIYPTAFVETGTNANVGARLVHSDLYGDGGSLRMRVGYGRPTQQVYAAQLGSGTLPGTTLKLFVSGRFQRSNRGRYYGVGNPDEVRYDEQSMEPSGIDTRARELAVETRYTLEEIVGQMWLMHSRPGKMIRLTQQLRKRSFDPLGDVTDDPSPIDVFQPDGVIGFESGVTDTYSELFMLLDTRKRERETRGPFDLRAAAWGGVQVNTNLNTYFGRVGFDLQPIVRVYRHNRSFRLRLRFHSVIGHFADVPFEDLASLGGNLLLRGYRRGRFFDRHALLTTAEYRYPINDFMGLYFFLDAGRVYANLNALGFQSYRFGYGGGFRMLAGETLLFRMQLASSPDGNVIFNLTFGGTDAVGNTF